jgi:hypothetical protein
LAIYLPVEGGVHMIYLSNQDIARLLTPKDCIEALDEAFHALARGAAMSRPRTDVWVPCGRDDGYYRWGSMEGAIEPWGVFCTRMKSDIVTWTRKGPTSYTASSPAPSAAFLCFFSTRNAWRRWR